MELEMRYTDLKKYLTVFRNNNIRTSLKPVLQLH